MDSKILAIVLLGSCFVLDAISATPCVGEEGFCNWDDKKCCAMNSSKKRLRCNQYHHSGKCQVNQWQPEPCPDSCKTCKAGGAGDGGKPLNSEGRCDYFCSSGG